MYGIKDMLGILVIVSVNVINHVMLVCWFVDVDLDYQNCKCRKGLVDKLVKECGENVDEAKLSGVTLFEHENVFTKFLLSWV